MKNATQTAPRTDRGRLLRDYDLLEIDSPDTRSWWHVRYMERIGATLSRARRLLPHSGVVLEVGASQANMSLLLAERGYQAIALDNSEHALQYARQKWERGHLCLLVSDAQQLPLADASLDLVLLAEVIEHLPDPPVALCEAHRVLKPTGHVVLSAPNATYLGERLPDYNPETMSAADAVTGPEARHHLYAFTHRSLRTLAADAGFDTVHAGYVGTVVHSSHLRWLYRLLPVGPVLAAGRLLLSLPGLRCRLAQTCLVVLRPKPHGPPDDLTSAASGTHG